MTLNQMQYFVEVCKCGSISGAAERLHVAQPSVSMAMQALEQETGLNLFYREKNKISLTPEANVLFEKISAILEKMDELNRDIESMTGKASIRIALPLQLGITFMPAIFGDFCVQHPDIKVEIVEVGGIKALKMVEDGRVDIAFTNFHENVGDNLSYKKLFDCECLFCTWKGHPLSEKETVTFKEVAKEPLVMLGSNFVTYKATLAVFKKHRLKLRIMHETPYLHTAKNLVKQHLASTILIRQGVLPEEFDSLSLISFEEPFYLDSGIVVKKGRQIYPHEEVLMKYLKEIVGGATTTTTEGKKGEEKTELALEIEKADA